MVLAASNLSVQSCQSLSGESHYPCGLDILLQNCRHYLPEVVGHGQKMLGQALAPLFGLPQQ